MMMQQQESEAQPPRSLLELDRAQSIEEGLEPPTTEGMVFMKEEDAAILERGLGDSCSTGQTPVLQAMKIILEKNLPSIYIEGQDCARERTTSVSSMREDVLSSQVDTLMWRSARPDASPTRDFSERPPMKRDESKIREARPSVNDRDSARIVYRRCLSGDIRPTVTDVSLVTVVDEDTYASPVSVREDMQQQQFALELATSEDVNESGQAMRSIKSIGRMMSEAAQFAEAVGELPPLHEDELQEIIDEGGSDYDDDSTSAKEIRVDNINTRIVEEIHEQPTAEETASDESRVFSHERQTSERLLIEVSQFAEAVGEAPPTHLEMQEIIEGGSDDDDDDDSAKEVHVDQMRLSLVLNDGIVESNSQFQRMGDEENLPDNARSANDLTLNDSLGMLLVRQKSRPRWPFKHPIETENGYLHQLPNGVNTPDFVYKGICSNPPEITKQGMQRGNYAQLHRKAWLEVSDKYHRYGKNLRLYYRFWERLGFPSSSFFDWLDSKGEAAGEPLPNLPECPRSQLDSDTVLYITNPDVTQGYMLDIVSDSKGRGLVVDVDGDPVQTGSEGWIFVLRDSTLYGAPKITSVTGSSKQRFHHSSFFGGKAVAAAGILITDDDGYLSRLYPHSGHYRPGEAHMQRMLFYVHHKGVDLRTFDMDTQQILHLARFDANMKDGIAENPGPEKKKKKVDSLHLKPAIYVARFLAHKARFIGAGIFTQIHKIRKADVTSVTEALDQVDNGGFWRGIRDDLCNEPSLQM